MSVTFHKTSAVGESEQIARTVLIPTERQAILTYSHGRWRALTRRNVQVEAHFCYTECARRADLLGFTPVMPA